MPEFFEIFAPGQRFWREQQDLDNTLVVEQSKGGKGPLQLDLDAGTVTIRVPTVVNNPHERAPQPTTPPSKPANTASTDRGE